MIDHGSGHATDIALERILTLDALRRAWWRVHRNHGSAGADGVSLVRFERNLDANLLALADEVRAGTYQPGSYRRVTITDRGKDRSLAILPVRDRVLQRAAVDHLMPHLDPIFLPCSFGYRPGRSLRQAVDRIVRYRNSGWLWFVDTDIQSCFDRLDHDILRELVSSVVPDRDVCALIDRWIMGPPRRRSTPPTRGIPQGAVISPLLCNLYLHQLDRRLRRRRHNLIRYADDFVVPCKSEFHAERALRMTECPD